MLVLIKLLHTLIWAIMAAATLFIFYAGIVGLSGPLLTVCIALLSVESLVLIFNGWVCPLTPVAARYTAERGASFDIYLPKWLARYNKLIFGTIFVIGLFLVVANRLTRR